jgi:hypothetical protein
MNQDDFGVRPYFRSTSYAPTPFFEAHILKTPMVVTVDAGHPAGIEALEEHHLPRRQLTQGIESLENV